MIIIQNINTLHGEYGSKIFFDILKHCPKNCRAFIRVDARNYIKFRQCLAVVTEWKEISCQFVCHKVSILSNQLILIRTFDPIILFRLF
ncbi:hypothetical protein QR98_0047250 [Sarcoptes scabiei]|uniref:Uncharacterized protein n=1 Tax=Sarcoptes scabiei TaxID=52283 RepID=A0A132A5L5_SARSC|nr:hypothetical protein QR98_0047250 [Sarcoptes scabiei]